MKLKKIMVSCLGLSCCFMFLGCDKKEKTAPTTTVEAYPYMNYLEKEVIAASNLGFVRADGQTYGFTFDEEKKTSLKEVVKNNDAFPDAMYDVLIFKFKSGCNLKKMTFTITANEDLSVEPRCFCLSKTARFGDECYGIDNPAGEVVRYRGGELYDVNINRNNSVTFTVGFRIEDGEENYFKTTTEGLLSDERILVLTTFIAKPFPINLNVGSRADKFDKDYMENNKLISISSVNFEFE